MTFAEARERIKELAGESAYELHYSELHCTSGQIITECGVMIIPQHPSAFKVVSSKHSIKNWSLAIADIRDQLNPSTAVDQAPQDTCPECTSTIDGGVCQSSACKSRLE